MTAPLNMNNLQRCMAHLHEKDVESAGGDEEHVEPSAHPCYLRLSCIQLLLHLRQTG